MVSGQADISFLSHSGSKEVLAWGSLSGQPQLPTALLSKVCWGGGSWGRIFGFSPPLVVPQTSESGSNPLLSLVSHVMGTLGRSWRGWGRQRVLEGALPRGHPPPTESWARGTTI